jgi:hypothetical protein
MGHLAHYESLFHHFPGPPQTPKYTLSAPELVPEWVPDMVQNRSFQGF